MTGIKTILFAAITMLVLAPPASAWKMFTAAQPDSGLVSNSFVDILYHEGIVWIATGQGLSYTSDLGQSWYTHTKATGLVSDEPSALFGRPGQLWVAGTHFQDYEGINYPFGDGINITTDGGNNWSLVTPPEASSFAQLVYDIAGTDSSTYAACFHGGMIVSHDFGTTWKHVFYSPADSLDWNADHWADSLRYYSCAVDTTHADTLIVYGGSARGINKFIYLPKRVKLGGNRIYDIVEAGDLTYFSHDGGVTQCDSLVQRYYTADTGNGLGSNWIRKIVLFGGRLWAAAFDPADSSGRGLYYLNNPESVWTAIAQNTSGPEDLWTRIDADLFAGAGSGVLDFKAYHDTVLYVAAGDSGLFRSLDTGRTWARFFVDSTDTQLSSSRNKVYSIDATADSLYLGTKAGLVKAAYTAPLTITYDTLITFAENDSSGSFVSVVRHNDGTYPFTWVGVEPQTGAGNYAAIFLDTTGRSTIILYGPRAAVTRIYDFHVSTGLTVIAASSGLLGSLNVPSPLAVAYYNVYDLRNGLTLLGYDFYSAEIVRGRLFTGSAAGFGYLLGNEWRVVRVNTDPKNHDLASARTRENSDLPGNWVVAVDVQPRGDSAILWAACRRVPDTLEQTNAVAFSTDYGATWHQVLTNEQVWNFAFDRNGTAYAAASTGLYFAAPPWDQWERAALIDLRTMDTIITQTEVFAAEVADSILWVGTELGLAWRPLGDMTAWTIDRNFKSTESADDVFASPVPYSPLSFNGRLSLHYYVEHDASVTVEVYDFAMNLVRVVAEDRFRAGGADYFETWDGYNERGDMVATGIYYFKVSYSTGRERWGRLAIIP